MTDINSLTVIGRLTKDIGGTDFAYLNTGIAKLSFSIAVNRSIKRGEEWVEDVSYFDITYWGKPAEAIIQYLGKGKQVCVKGYLKQDRWEKDGQKHSKVGIVAESVQLLGGNNSNSGNTASYEQPPSKSAFTPKAQQLTQQQETFDTEFPEDIPF